MDHALEQVVALGERQHGGRLAGQELAVGADLVGLGIDREPGQRVVELHVALGQAAAAADHRELLSARPPGHGSGGTLVLLAAERSDHFRAAFSIGGDPLFDHPEIAALVVGD